MNTHTTSSGAAPDLRKFLGRFVLRYWAVYMAAMIVGTVAGVLVLRYHSPTYLIEAGLLIKGEQTGRDLDGELLLEDLGLNRSSTNLENEIQILKSRSLMLEVIDELGLDVSYAWEGRVRHTEIFDVTPITVDTFALDDELWEQTFRVRSIDGQMLEFGMVGGAVLTVPFDSLVETPWGAFRFRYQPSEIPFGKPILLRFHPRIERARELSRALQVNPIGESNMLRLSIEDPVPERGEALINRLMGRYNAASVADKQQVGINTLTFVGDRLDYLAADLLDVEKSVENYKQSRNIPGNLAEGIPVWMRQQEEAEQERQRLEIALAMATRLRAVLTADSLGPTLWPDLMDLGSAEATDAVSQYNELVLKRQQLLVTATPQSPVVMALDQQLGNLGSRIRDNLDLTILSISQQIQKIDQKLSGIRSRIQILPQQERELTEILRQQGIKENLYLYLLEKREETALSLAITEPNARVIDVARAGPPITLSPFTLLPVGLFGGLFLATLVVAIREMLNDKVQTEEDIRELCTIPVSGAVLKARLEAHIAISAGSRTPQAEMFRLLRTNLQYFTNHAPCPVTLITSSTSGEGKTFTAVNLGIAFALSGKRTAVVGLDLRKPRLEQYLGVPEEHPGITNYLLGDFGPSDIVYPSPVADLLSYVPSGPIPPNPAEILLSPRLRGLFDHLTSHFDHVLVDSSPVGLVADSLLLAPHLTNTLFVVHADVTRKDMLRHLQQLHETNKLPRPAIVLNGVRRGKGYGYGGYYN